MTPLDDLQNAAALLRERVAAAREFPEERWTVDQSPDSGLVVGSYMPGDVTEDGTVATSCIAYFAYPGDDAQRAHGRAFGVASFVSGLDPAVGALIAEWLDSQATDLRRSGGRVDSCDSPGDVHRAVDIARAYLRRTD